MSATPSVSQISSQDRIFIASFCQRIVVIVVFLYIMCVDFLNEADSVLVVSSIFKYMQCNTTDPIQELPAGNTVFRFTRYGFYYFISGQVAHCVAGQRMIVRVMVHPDPGSISPLLPPALSPSDEAAAPGGYYNEPVSSPSPVPSSSGSSTHYHNVSSAAKVGAGYGSLSVIGALLVIGL